MAYLSFQISVEFKTFFSDYHDPGYLCHLLSFFTFQRRNYNSVAN